MESTYYRVKIDDKYLKYTSRFGPFYGSIVTTNKASEAKLFSKEKDAKKKCKVIYYRLASYEKDKKKFPNFEKCYFEKVQLMN